MSVTEIAAAERALLEKGWEWMRTQPEGPDLDAFHNDRWLPKLREYERRYGMELEKILPTQIPLDRTTNR